MEKKGDLLNQLAVISDLIERTNIESESNTIIFGLSNDEFDKIFDLIQKKQNIKTVKPKDTFTISIGKVEIVFSRNSV